MCTHTRVDKKIIGRVLLRGHVQTSMTSNWMGTILKLVDISTYRPSLVALYVVDSPRGMGGQSYA